MEIQEINRIYMDKYEKDVSRVAEEFTFDTSNITAGIIVRSELEAKIKDLILKYYLESPI